MFSEGPSFHMDTKLKKQKNNVSLVMRTFRIYSLNFHMEYTVVLIICILLYM